MCLPPPFRPGHAMLSFFPFHLSLSSPSSINPFLSSYHPLCTWPAPTMDTILSVHLFPSSGPVQYKLNLSGCLMKKNYTFVFTVLWFFPRTECVYVCLSIDFFYSKLISPKALFTSLVDEKKKKIYKGKFKWSGRKIHLRNTYGNYHFLESKKILVTDAFFLSENS